MIGALLACALGAATAAPSALEAAAAQLARQACPPASGKVAIVVSSPETPELARAAQTALASALAAPGVAALPLPGPLEGAEEAARAAGADWLVRVTARVEGADLTLAGDLVPTWVNFWVGQQLVRRPGGGPLAARSPADAQALTLAHLPLPRDPEAPPHGAIATRFALRPFARLPERVVALAVGDLDGDGLAEVALLTPTQALVLAPNGQLAARRELAALPRSPRPPREPAGTLAIEPVAGGRARLLAFDFRRARGEALELEGGELRPVASLEHPAACAGPAGVVLGAQVPGKNVLAAEVRLSGRSAALPFAPLSLGASPRPGNPAFVAVGPDGQAVLLDAELGASAVPGPVGAAIALGDLYGDGAAELVTTLFGRGEDRVRLRRPGAPAPLFESEPLAASLVVAAAGDLDGDGRDEAVLAGWTPDGSALHVLGALR